MPGEPSDGTRSGDRAHPSGLGELESRVRERVGRDVFDYFAGGAGDEITLRENEAAWKDLRVVPRVLRDVTMPSTTTSVLGVEVGTPAVVAPVAYQCLLDPEGERATAMGARSAGAIMTVPTRTSVRLADLEEDLGPWWFQVYILEDRVLTRNLVREATQQGCGALVLTADAPYLGDRHRDRKNNFTVPVWIATGATGHGGDRSNDIRQDPGASFEDIAWLAECSHLPILVKGVLHPDDARRCIEAGAAGIVVSNHGGRQFDRAVPTAVALPPIVKALGPSVPVLVDGGLRSGADILVALALGAHAVMLGRPVMWGLGSQGAEGVAAVIQKFTTELCLAMALCGVARLDELDDGLLVFPPSSVPSR